jgi:hypothetical protein
LTVNGRQLHGLQVAGDPDLQPHAVAFLVDDGGAAFLGP